MWVLHSLCVKPFRVLGLLTEKTKNYTATVFLYAVWCIDHC